MDGWYIFSGIKEAENAAKDYRIKYINWDGPGWYWKRSYTQRCPRNCCDDWVISLVSAKEKAKELVEEIREKAFELAEARKKVENRA